LASGQLPYPPERTVGEVAELSQPPSQPQTTSRSGEPMTFTDVTLVAFDSSALMVIEAREPVRRMPPR
jgi:hypothetical protein